MIRIGSRSHRIDGCRIVLLSRACAGRVEYTGCGIRRWNGSRADPARRHEGKSSMAPLTRRVDTRVPYYATNASLRSDQCAIPVFVEIGIALCHQLKEVIQQIV